MKESILQCIRVCVLASVGGLAIGAPQVHAGDWNQWRGPERDGKASDTGLLQRWPASGPALDWKAAGVGSGYSSVSVVGDRLFTMGDKDDAGRVIALRVSDGTILWTARVGAAGAPDMQGYSYPGPRCTPTVSGDLVFALDAWGEIVCVNAADGQEQWRKSLTSDFGGKPPTWGYSESPLVDGNQVVVTPGGAKGALVALDKQTGEMRWQSRDFTDEAHYSSIVAGQIAGARQYVQLTPASVVGIAPADGSVLWRAARVGRVAVIPTPVISGDYVYVTSGYNIGSNLFKVTADAERFSAEQVYANRAMANQHGGVIKVGDYVYGYSDSRGFACQNFLTGDIVWAEKEKIKKGCVSYADGCLYCREETSGTVILLAASPDGYQEKGRFLPPDRSKEHAWAHPTIANGKLYLRDQDQVLCYSLK